MTKVNYTQPPAFITPTNLKQIRCFEKGYSALYPSRTPSVPEEIITNQASTNLFDKLPLVRQS